MVEDSIPYESGRRNPKQASLEAIAKALAVNVEALNNSEFDGVKAMHRLFQVFRQYSGRLFECKDSEGNDAIGISFDSLPLMVSWYSRYEEYIKEVEECNKIKDIKERANALIKAEEKFDWWMDIYPESEPDQQLLSAMKAHDTFMDFLGNNPKNEE